MMKSLKMLAILPVLAATVAVGQSPSATQSADRFTLDLPPVDPDTDVTSGPATPTSTPLPAPEIVTIKSRFTIDTPIAKLLTNYRAKAILDREMPGLSVDKNLDKFKGMSLRKLAPVSDGRLSPELLERVGRDLAAIE